MLRIMAENLSNWVKNWGLSIETAIVLVVQVMILGILIPWSREVNSQLAAGREFQAATKAWMEQGPRFTTKDADNLRLTMRNEMAQLIADSIDKLNKRIQDLEDMRRRDTDSISSRLNAAAESSMASKLVGDHLTTRVSELANRISDLRSEVRQFLIDADFQHNSNSITK